MLTERADICKATMRMSVHQVSQHVAVLTPLDREAINWWHCHVYMGFEYDYPYHVTPHQASTIVSNFVEEGGIIATV